MYVDVEQGEERDEGNEGRSGQVQEDAGGATGPSRSGEAVQTIPR